MKPNLPTGLLLILTPILFMTAFTLLQINFEYPDILRQPGIEVMKKFSAGGVELIANWYLMVISSILFIPISVMLHPYLMREDTPFMPVATTLGVTAGIVQMLGFIRWPFLVPTLVSTYLDPSTSEATRAAIEVTFNAFNQYAGVVGWVSIWVLFLLQYGASLSPLQCPTQSTLANGLAGWVRLRGLAFCLAHWNLWVCRMSVWLMRLRIAYGLSGSLLLELG